VFEQTQSTYLLASKMEGHSKKSSHGDDEYCWVRPKSCSLCEVQASERIKHTSVARVPGHIEMFAAVSYCPNDYL
jgi:hypothetical protein